MTTSPHRDPVLYIDCTASLRSGLKTGIQKVVWALVEHANVFAEVLGIDCLPIAYQYNSFYQLADARSITLDTQQNFQPIDFCYRDIYLCADSFWTMEIFQWYPFFRDRGVSIATLIYDLIPLTHPEYTTADDQKSFEHALSIIIKYSQLLPCISRETRRVLMSYCSVRGISLPKDIFPVIPLAPALRVLPDNEDIPEGRLPDMPFFLMVGTVEPRRGYQTALREFCTYWASGGDKALVIIGKPGALGEAIGNELSSASQQGLPLTWLKDASDCEVSNAYHRSTAVVCASHAEGYGMSVSEGLKYNGLVLANRLSVFGEFAGSLPYYFDTDVEGDLVQLLHRVEFLKRRIATIDMGNWEETARVLAGHLARISLAHGSHTGIELDRNSPEAVRWAYWLAYGRVCNAEELQHYLSYKSVTKMIAAIRYEARRPEARLSAELIRSAYSMILGRDSCSDDEVAYWLSRCSNLRELSEHLVFEAMRARVRASGMKNK